MGSFQITISPKRRAAARFISDVRRAIQEAFAVQQSANGLTQSEIARRLEVHRSIISRELRGNSDLTLGRVGELAWALGKKAVFELEDIETGTDNMNLASQFTIQTEVGSKPTALRSATDRVVA